MKGRIQTKFKVILSLKLQPYFLRRLPVERFANNHVASSHSSRLMSLWEAAGSADSAPVFLFALWAAAYKIIKRKVRRVNTGMTSRVGGVTPSRKETGKGNLIPANHWSSSKNRFIQTNIQVLLSVWHTENHVCHKNTSELLGFKHLSAEMERATGTGTGCQHREVLQPPLHAFSFSQKLSDLLKPTHGIYGSMSVSGERFCCPDLNLWRTNVQQTITETIWSSSSLKTSRRSLRTH